MLDHEDLTEFKVLKEKLVQKEKRESMCLLDLPGSLVLMDWMVHVENKEPKGDKGDRGSSGEKGGLPGHKESVGHQV